MGKEKEVLQSILSLGIQASLVLASPLVPTIVARVVLARSEFAISNIGDWLMEDLDGGATYGANDVEFTNESYVGTGIIYNHALATSTMFFFSLHSQDPSLIVPPLLIIFF